MWSCRWLLLLPILASLGGCHFTGSPPVVTVDVELEMKDPLTRANFGLLGVEFYESSNNAKRWNIDSEFAEIHRAENTVFMRTVTADFHASRTRNVIHTTSDQGRSSLNKNQVDLEGHVKIRSRTGYEFSMNSLVYEGEKHSFRSGDEVSMQGPNVEKPTMVLKGIGLTADINQEHFFLHRRVTARKRIKEDDWLRVTSSQGEFFTEEQHAVFEGHVVTTVPSGLTVESDFMNLTSTTDRELMEARGNVVLLSNGKRGWADKAFFEAGGDRVILEGSAKVESKKSQVKGRRIILYTMDDRVEVTEAEGRVLN